MIRPEEGSRQAIERLDEVSGQRRTEASDVGAQQQWPDVRVTGKRDPSTRTQGRGHHTTTHTHQRRHGHIMFLAFFTRV